MRLPIAAGIDLRIYDNGARVVRTLASGRAAPTSAQFAWDGRDEAGRTAAPGIYFHRMQSAAGHAGAKSSRPASHFSA